MTGKFKPTTIVVDAPICIGNWCPHNYKNSYMGSLPLMTALAHSLNTVAVRLSIAIGEANSVPGHNNTFEEAKRGRAKIIETARTMGLTTPLLDTVSLPIGAADVTVIDMASAYCTFANGGLRAPPYAAVEIANSRGEVIYRHDRDAPPPHRIVPADTIETMDSMLMQVVLAGTGRRAAARQHRGRRQDRHDQRLQGRLVHRLHRQLCRRHLVRQRRRHADEKHDRRLAARRDMA